MRVALVHDYLKGEGGAEQVLLALHELFPQAPIYTVFSNIGKKRATLFGRKFARAKIVESWFGRVPFCEQLISPLRFLLPWIWASFTFTKFDLIISSASWAVTKGLARGKTREICYCHTPPRYLYGYGTSKNWPKRWWLRAYALIVNHWMRQYDFKQAQKVTRFVANSREVQKRIQKFYRRDSVIINPPVDCRKFPKRPIPQNLATNTYFLSGGRLELPKNFDLIIKACNELKLPLKIYGSGSRERYLKSIAGPTVEFCGGVSDEEKIRLYQGCRAFITAAIDEDFGITPVEAMAAGRPVIAYRGGGYLETVVEGKTGEFFDQIEVVALTKTLRTFVAGNYRADVCRRRAREFSKESFNNKLLKLVNSYA